MSRLLNSLGTRKPCQDPHVAEKLGLGHPAGAEILEAAGESFQRLLLALAGARKYSRSRDPGGRRLGSTEIEAIRGDGMIPTATVAPLWGSETTHTQTDTHTHTYTYTYTYTYTNKHIHVHKHTHTHTHTRTHTRTHTHTNKQTHTHTHTTEQNQIWGDFRGSQNTPVHPPRSGLSRRSGLLVGCCDVEVTPTVVR